MSAFGKVLGLAGLAAAPFLPAAWAIPAALGGLGATKDEFIDAPEKRKSNEILAGAMRYSPWLGAQQLQNISKRETPDEGVDGFMKGAVQGAALSAGLGYSGMLDKGAGSLWSMMNPATAAAPAATTALAAPGMASDMALQNALSGSANMATPMSQPGIFDYAMQGQTNAPAFSPAFGDGGVLESAVGRYQQSPWALASVRGW